MQIQAPYKPIPKEFTRADIDAIYAKRGLTTGSKILLAISIACFAGVAALVYFPVIH